ncbi:uncharacterized protein ARMOST_16112 [Armillaria ostoyae]|uniref:Uncharacterized protein n=1 Tax=Armillaria ostoyae TaxID=47428 RepID=A0A284RV97_ARMOS|nr:uncharacterized protein ARMOST_16112 [Armillaria ostoyae]
MSRHSMPATGDLRERSLPLGRTALKTSFKFYVPHNARNKGAAISILTWPQGLHEATRVPAAISHETE